MTIDRKLIQSGKRRAAPQERGVCWVPVTERLPPRDEDNDDSSDCCLVLMADDYDGHGDFALGFYLHDKRVWQLPWSDMDREAVSHWAPIVVPWKKYATPVSWLTKSGGYRW